MIEVKTIIGTIYSPDTLLACESPVTASQDENLFIAVHRICDLAFHQMILDLARVLNAIALSQPLDGLIGDMF